MKLVLLFFKSSKIQTSNADTVLGILVVGKVGLQEKFMRQNFHTRRSLGMITQKFVMLSIEQWLFKT